MRSVYTRIINEAFDAGYMAAWDFWHMTPVEVNGRLRAFAAIQQKKIEYMDTLAWMAGSYAAQAYHEPRRYPHKPAMVKRPAHVPRTDEEPLGDDMMQTILTAYAEIHNQIEEVNHNGVNAGRT